ncbi:Ankyrin repeat [Arabidopsis suecica]|uniref:Ankyrin repeat n=1 Tax=Arabidopsis suecica TaxID=45249 RepID=A0A8T2BDF7_ARASU|nr:Ankyrin repeat [Arabidopsis suecica]
MLTISQRAVYGQARYDFKPYDEAIADKALREAHTHIHLLQRFVKWQGRTIKKLVKGIKSMNGKMKTVETKLSHVGCSNSTRDDVEATGENQPTPMDEDRDARYSFQGTHTQEMVVHDPPRASSYKRHQRRKRRAPRSPTLILASSNSSYSLSTSWDWLEVDKRQKGLAIVDFDLRSHGEPKSILSPLPKPQDPCEIQTEAASLAEEAKSDTISAVIDRRDVPSRDTPLHLAVKLCDLTSVEMLMVAGADWTLQNEDGWNALQEAVCSRQEAIAMIIVRHYQPLAWAKWCRRLPRLIATMKDGEVARGSLYMVNHKEKEVMNALDGACGVPSEEEVNKEVAAMSKSNIFRPGIDVTQAVLSPQTNWRRQEKSEMVGPWKAKVYEMNNVVVSIKSRKVPGASVENGGVEGIDNDLCDVLTKPKPSSISSKTQHESEYKKGLRPVLWLSPNFPLQTEELLPLLDILANKVKAIRRLRELLTTKLPSGTFPVKVAIPVVPTVKVLVKFTKFEEIESVDEFKTPLSSPTASGYESPAVATSDFTNSSSSWFSRSRSNKDGSSSKSKTLQDPFAIPTGYTWAGFAENSRETSGLLHRPKTSRIITMARASAKSPPRYKSTSSL